MHHARHEIPPLGQRFPTPKHVTSTSPITSGPGHVTSGSGQITSGSGHMNSGSGHMTSCSSHMTSAKVTFDPGRDHMIKRNGTSPSLVQICTLTFRGGSFRYKFPYRPPILLGAKPFTYNKRKTTLTLWYKKTWTHARVLLDAQLPLFHLPFTKIKNELYCR